MELHFNIDGRYIKANVVIEIVDLKCCGIGGGVEYLCCYGGLGCLSILMFSCFL